ncbi:hypothetical protein TNCT_486851 [Trichonephila clavata]|uniref:Uncharacterized protein n=1 Tax=Trichonephila clavata TaxID=2740835 RepID=A0A8X6L2K0_TRICU|nr:hypothetical protein TNCT_486851 [Trichonephila clavata]
MKESFRAAFPPRIIINKKKKLKGFGGYPDPQDTPLVCVSDSRVLRFAGVVDLESFATGSLAIGRDTQVGHV